MVLCTYIIFFIITSVDCFLTECNTNYSTPRKNQWKHQLFEMTSEKDATFRNFGGINKFDPFIAGNTINKKGYDERYPTEKTSEDMYRIILFYHYLEQIEKLEKCNHMDSSNIEWNEIINQSVQDILPNEIKSTRIKSGGLMDDWEIHIED